MSFSDLKRTVVGTGLCSSCGTCVGICPVSCIDINRKSEPQLTGACTDCGLCLKFCPSIDFDFRRYNVVENGIQRDLFIGGYRRIYFGHTTDPKIRNIASGGGIVSALLISALQNGLIDGVIVVKMDEERIGQAKTVIAETRAEVLEAMQSKYIPVPLNIVLKEIKSRKGKFGLVGLPCHVHAVRKLQASGPEWCKDKIKILIGLFCGSCLHDNFIDYILSVLEIDKNDVKEMHFRHRRNPTTSSLLITTNDGREYFLNRSDYSWLFYLFAKEACLYCIDHTNEFADISIGDMRPFPTDSPNYRIIEPLQSVIIVRTREGEELLKHADNINLSKYDLHDLIASKLTNMIDKKICSHTRMRIRQKMGFPIPNFNQSVMTNYPLPSFNLKIISSNAFTASRFLYEFLWLTTIHLIQHENMANLLSKIPFKTLKTCVKRGYLRFKTKGYLCRI
jgi:coenzyme F420 hydrogenase subunit beta